MTEKPQMTGMDGQTLSGARETLTLGQGLRYFGVTFWNKAGTGAATR